MPLKPKDLLKIYSQLRLVRTFDERINSLYRQGKIVGGVYSSMGQEAVTVGSCYCLRKDDVVAPVHRDLGAFLCRGMDPKLLMAQIMGKKMGPTGGKDSFLHAGDLALGIIAPTSILASSIPIATGIGLAFLMRNEDHVAVSYFGEGSTAKGDFHEGLNFAGIHKLPVVYICENNMYAYSTPVEKEMPTETVAERAAAYGMPGVTVDGNDVIAVHAEVEKAVNRARRKMGSSLIECRTYRIHGHSEHDMATYRSKEELDEWKIRDPIVRLEAGLLQQGILDEEKVKQTEQEATLIVDEATEFAEKSPFPEGAEALEGVYGANSKKPA